MASTAQLEGTGPAVGSPVVGEIVGDVVGSAVVGDTDGDAVGEQVTSQHDRAQTERKLVSVQH